MDTAVTAAVISAAAVVIVTALSFYLTKQKEREADWRKYKFEQYKDLLIAISEITGTDSTPEGQRHFARACNTLHLIGSREVVTALHEFQNEIRVSNPSASTYKHDRLLAKLIWEIREDLKIPHNSGASDFSVRLWTSGVPSNNSGGR